MFARLNISKASVAQVELIGGGIRVPLIQTVCASYFEGIEVGQHMNGDESEAFGAAIYAAKFSQYFKVKETIVNDGLNYGFEIVLKNS